MSAHLPLDPVDLTAKLIRCNSVTPLDGGAMDVLQEVLSAAGFDCSRVDRGGICNLFARWGAKGANRSFGFNGHTDVVPVGDLAAWKYDPFGAVIEEGWLYGRGATDMKSGVAAFVAAAVDFVRQSPPSGAIVIAITGDEEDVAKDGTLALLDWMAANGERMSHCLVGEPTSPNHMGEMMKIGRRGSLTAHFTAHGLQGHAAYPHRAKNPMSALAKLMVALEADPLDQGSAHFEASTLAITTIDCGNPANNVIPAQGKATVNIRFNDLHSGASLSDWLLAQAAAVQEETGVKIDTRISISGESFITPPGDLSAMISRAVPICTMRPPCISAMRLPILKASSRSWLTKMIVRLSRFCRSSSSSCNLARMSGSSAEKGSSIKRIGASVTKARARPTRCCMPPESSETLRSAQSDRPTRSSWASIRARRSALLIPANSSPSPTLSRTLRQGSRPKF